MSRIQSLYPDLPKIDVHSFSHTWATLVLEAGLSVQAVQKQLGHSSFATTMNFYAKYTNKMKKKDAQTMSRYLNGAD